jgi:phosphohistidine phosphatase
MRQLLLCRHAKSRWPDSDQEDSLRPLSARGERDAPRIGERLDRHGLHPSLVVTSPAVRARRTAKLLADALRYPRENIRLEPALYLASPTTLLAVVAAQDDDAERVLIVAHNPGLTDLTNHLLPDFDLDNLPTGAVIAIDFDAQGWADLVTAPRQLAYYDYPKNPDAPVTPS